MPSALRHNTMALQQKKEGKKAGQTREWLDKETCSGGETMRVKLANKLQQTLDMI